MAATYTHIPYLISNTLVHRQVLAGEAVNRCHARGISEARLAIPISRGRSAIAAAIFLAMEANDISQHSAIGVSHHALQVIVTMPKNAEKREMASVSLHFGGVLAIFTLICKASSTRCALPSGNCLTLVHL